MRIVALCLIFGGLGLLGASMFCWAERAATLWGWL